MDEEIWTVIAVCRENGHGRKEEKHKFFEELQRQIDNGEDQRIVLRGGRSDAKTKTKNGNISGITLYAAETICGITEISNRNTRNAEWWTDEIRGKIKNKKGKWKK